ncbi:MAG: hypoxanthine phosphoribosyltransferase [Tissierellia bacterium]|nr:hypoxanthine phosphoribosyltransferase [Tissierellia bacterium]
MAKTEKILIERKEIEKRVVELAGELDERFQGVDLLVVPLLRGGFVFAADLVREMKTRMEIDFLTTSSYEHQEVSTGNVKIFGNLRAQVKDRHVLIIDDIVDSGRTMESVVEYMKSMGPASVTSVVLLDKPSRREVDFHADYAAFTIEDVFIVGFGLDYESHYRNVPYIYTYVDED